MKSDPKQNHSRNSRRRIVLTSLLLLATYVGSYYYLSRRGNDEAAKYGMEGFLYVPADEVFKRRDVALHHVLAVFYSPLNWFDHEFFGSPRPVGCVLFDLS